MFKKLLTVMFLILPVVSHAEIELTDAQIEELLDVKIRFATHMAYQPNIIRAVEAQNGEKLTLSEIKDRDQMWIDANGGSNTLIREITRNEIARYLKRRVENNSAIDEVFITDNQGANVAAYPPTSDYWQGDEGKFTSSFNEGDGQVFIGPLELDASTNKTQVQISAPIVSNNQTIGVLILGVSVDYLSSQQ
jgi:hypothetical protein